MGKGSVYGNFAPQDPTTLAPPARAGDEASIRFKHTRSKHVLSYSHLSDQIVTPLPIAQGLRPFSQGERNGDLLTVAQNGQLDGLGHGRLEDQVTV